MLRHKKSHKNSKRSVDWLTLKHFYEVGARFRREHLLSWLTPVAALGLGVFVPFYVGKILATLAHPDAHEAPLFAALIITSVVTIIINSIAYANYLAWQPKVMAALQTEALAALLHRSVSFHNNRVSGKLVSDAIDYPQAYSQLSNVIFVDILPFTAVMIIGIVVVTIHAPIFGLVLLAMVSLAVGTSIHFRRRMTPYRHRRLAAGKAVTAHLADTIVNNQTVKTFGAEEFELSKHKVFNGTLLAARIHDWGEVAKDGRYRITGLLLFETVFVMVVAHQVHHNPALLATGIFAFAFTVTLSNRLFQIASMVRQLEEALLQASPMTEMLQEAIEIVDAPDAGKLEVGGGNVHFDAVTFAYQDNPHQDPVFKSLNINIQDGEKVGLVGPSGGGKSTLTKLLLRFEDIASGRILIDDQDITQVTQHSLRDAISYVSQEPLLFHRSIRENIAYGNAQAHLTEIKAAARKAHADEFIAKLPNGYDTVVGERGVKLSGGQRQRIAIARAILKNAPILVLDEATSALDSASEKAIQSALAELMKNKTTIVIAHRLSTIQRLDRIIVLDEGKIVEQGSHQKLLESAGLYATLWAHQSGGFIDGDNDSASS